MINGWFLQGQTPDIPIQVINSCGGSGIVTSGSSTVFIDYNVGEVAIATIGGAKTITQGFLQPDFCTARFYIDTAHADISCIKKKDGMIHIVPNNATANSTIVTQWTPDICPSKNCLYFDTLQPNLYKVIILYYDGSGAPADTIKAAFRINKNDKACPMNIYNIVTPNGDGQNDIFLIENIEDFQDNIVYIYNRWGDLLSEIHNYNNTNNYWSGTVVGDGNKADDSKNKNLPSGTYYYVIDLKDGSKVIKGFIELVRKN